MHTSFRTTLAPFQAPVPIRHEQRLLLLGSCFTEHIGQKLAERKFDALVNPFGIVYNPLSMVQCLTRLAAENQGFMAEDFFENAGLWHSWQHHGRFSKPALPEALEAANSAYQTAAQHLKQTDVLLLTFGTADVFTLRESGQVVANNHKMPSAHFDSRRLSVSEIVDNVLRVAHLAPHIILSISPVRHLRGGLMENQRSKATLLLACDEICRQVPHAQYFPAYELLLDDLRDYRFYAADMVHPSEVAIEYVWEFFSDTYFGQETRLLNQRLEKIRSAVAHRPFHPHTEQHRAFATTQLAAIAQLKKEMPALDFRAEEAVFRAAAGLG